jgi:7-carboxy-7-deazaguanine synthase
MRINEIFKSINGEVSPAHQGSLCTFIRTSGCNLDCQYPCDTPYAKSLNSGKEMSINEIIQEVEKFNNINITITGGEPTIQLDVLELSKQLYVKGYRVSIETNGTYNMKSKTYLSWVADWKCPSSGMRNKMDIENFISLRFRDIIKFIIADKKDFNDALMTITALLERGAGCKFAFSPSFGQIEPEQLIKWMKAEPTLGNIGAIMSYQIHKLLHVK